MVNAELVRNLLKELEAERGVPIQLKVEKSSPALELRANTDEYFGALYDREVTIVPVEGKGREYEIAAQFAGTYSGVGMLQKLIEKTMTGEWEDLNGPMNIDFFKVRTDGIFALVHGTYHPDGIIKPHPGFENAKTPYELKVADLSLKLIE